MTLLVESCPGYRRITLNRPERLNALNVEMAAALDAAFDEAAADKTCRAILLTGAGRGFCAGQDLTEIIGASPADLDRLLAHYHPLILDTHLADPGRLRGQRRRCRRGRQSRARLRHRGGGAFGELCAGLRAHRPRPGLR